MGSWNLQEKIVNVINYYLRNTISRNLFEKECKLQFHDFFSKFKDLATVFDERTTVLALSTLFHQKAEQYKENVPKVRILCFNFRLLILLDFLSREKMTEAEVQPKAE